MPRRFSSDQAITPDREVRVVFDPNELVCLRLGEGTTREKGEIGRASQVGVGNSQSVELVGDYWQLSTAQRDPSNINEQTDFQPLIIRAADMLIAIPYGEYPNFRQATDITGVSYGVSTQDQGDFFIRKDFQAGVSADQSFTDDTLQFPQPPPVTNAHAPVDRIAIGKKTQPANCGYHFRFEVPGTRFHAPDIIAVFYFGGASGAAFNPSLGFALVIYGSGDAELWELSTQQMASNWRVLCRFNFSPPGQVAGRAHSITIQPHGTKTISFSIASASRAVSHGRSSSVAPGYANTPPTTHAAKYVASAVVAGYVPGKAITGPGNIRLDVRRDQLLIWQISILDYAATGILVDHEFMWGAPLPGGTVMTMATNVIVPDGCAFDVDLFTADDVAMTSPVPKVYVGGWVWQFSSIPGKAAYFAAFSFSGNSTDHTSPQLRRFSIKIDALFGQRVGRNVVFPVDQTDELEIAITGTDGDPSHESAHVHIINKDGRLTIPRRWGRLKTRIECAYIDPAAPDEVRTTALFDGQSIQIERTPFGAASDVYARDSVSPYASDYDGVFAGKWAKGREVFTHQLIMLGDFTLDVDLPTGKAPTLRVTDVIRDVFVNVIGVHPVMLDIPDLPVPFSGPEIDKDVMLQPKQNPFEYVLHLCRDYLGAVLFWDRNAGPWGVWRVRPQVDIYGAQGDPLFAFVFGPDSFDGKDPIAPESYPAETTWIERDSYQDWTEPPEYNYIRVWAPNPATALPNEAGLSLCTQFIWNPDSFDLFPDAPTANPDPDANPDYVGEMLPALYYDPTVGVVPEEEGGVQGYVDALARLLYEQYAHARKHFRLRAPFFPVKDEADTLLNGRRRPLRHNDLITVGGLPAIVKCCNLERPLKNDFQMQWIEGIFESFPIADFIL